MAGAAGTMLAVATGTSLLLASPPDAPAPTAGSPTAWNDASYEDIPRGDAPGPTEPKAEAVLRLSAAVTDALATHLPSRTATDHLHPGSHWIQIEPNMYPVIALCKTAAGVARIAATAPVTGADVKAEDFVASLGGTSSRGPDDPYRAIYAAARANVVLAAVANSIAMIDGVHAVIADHVRLAQEAEDAAAPGFRRHRLHLCGGLTPGPWGR